MDDGERPIDGRSRSWDVALSLVGLGAIEADVQGFLDEARLDAHALYVTRLVIEEIVANLVKHAARDERSRATVTVTITPAMATVTVVDDELPFDPLSAPELDVSGGLADRRPGGMGLHLVRQLVDALRYDRVDGRNRLVAEVRRA